MIWKKSNSFPDSSGEWAFFRPPSKKIKTGKPELEYAIRNWHSFDPILASTPDSLYFLPPVCQASLAIEVHMRMLKQVRFIIYYIIFCFTLLGILFASSELSSQNQKLISLMGVLLLFLGFFMLDYQVVLKNIEYTRERAMYISYLYLKSGKQVKFACLLMATVGLVQYLALVRFEDLNSLLLSYGLLSDFNLSNDWWRLITGPYIHSGVVHWLSNFVYLVFVVALVSLNVNRPLLYFVFFNFVIALLFRYIPFPGRADVLVGVSGGVLALLGFVFYQSIQFKEQFPRHFWVTLGTFILLILGLSALLSPLSSEFIHLAGLTLGITCAFVVTFYTKPEATE